MPKRKSHEITKQTDQTTLCERIYELCVEFGNIYGYDNFELPMRRYIKSVPNAGVTVKTEKENAVANQDFKSLIMTIIKDNPIACHQYTNYLVSIRAAFETCHKGQTPTKPTRPITSQPTPKRLWFALSDSTKSDNELYKHDKILNIKKQKNEGINAFRTLFTQLNKEKTVRKQVQIQPHSPTITFNHHS